MKIFELIDKEDFTTLEKLLFETKQENKDFSEFSQSFSFTTACDFTTYVDCAIQERKPKALGIILRAMLHHNLPIRHNHIESIAACIKDIESNFKPVEYIKQIPKNINYTAIIDCLIREIFHLYGDVNGYFPKQFRNSIQEIMHWIIEYSGISLRSILRTIVQVRGHEKFKIELIQYILKINDSNFKELFAVNSLSKDSLIVLAYCAENYEILKWLLTLDFPFGTKDHEIDMFKILERNVAIFNPEIFTLLIHKCGGIEKFKNQNPSILEFAILKKNRDATDVLLSLGFKLTEKLPNGKQTYLQLLLSRDYWRSGSIIAFDLIKKHLDINDLKSWESVSLPELCLKKHFVIVRHLLTLKRDPNECDESGITAIDILRDFINKKDPDITFTPEEMTEIEKLQKDLLKYSDVVFVNDVPQLPEIYSVAVSNNVDLWPVYYLHWQRTQRIELDYKLAQEHLEFFRTHKIEFRKSPHKKVHLDPKKQTNLIHTDVEVMNALKNPKKSFLGRVKDLVVEDSSILFETLKKFPRFKDFVSQAESHWSLAHSIQDNLRRFDVYNQVKYGEQPAKFELDQFALNYYDFYNKREFSYSLQKLLEFMDSEFGKKISRSLSYQTISKHNAMLWSLSHRHRFSYFQKKLQQFIDTNIIFPFQDEIDKKLIQENNEYMLRRSVTFADITLNFMDFTSEEDYNFMVHTTSTLPENLKTTLETGADFIRNTPFFSCSIVDKDTPAAVMEHQDKTYVNNGKLLFPISLILDLADDAVIKAFSVDAWSPMLSRNKETAKELADDYLQKLTRMITVYNEIEYLVRTASTRTNDSTSTSLSHLDSDYILEVLTKNPQYKVPTSKSIGFLPDLTPLQVLKQTKSHFNEILVAGKKKNKIMGIMVEESALNAFRERFAIDIKLAAESPRASNTVEKIKQSLKLLAQSKYTLVLVKTNPNCFASKGSPYDRHKNLEESFQGCMRKVEQTMLRHHRLKKSKFTEQQPTVLATSEMSLKTALHEIETHRQNLAAIQEEILGQQMAAKPKVRV